MIRVARGLFAHPLRAALACSVAAGSLVAPGVAFAQDAAEDESGFEGNEIVVTATKREQTLQDVPVAVSVTTAATIERAQIRDIKDLSSVVPSLRVAERQTSANTNFFIRGFGNGANNAGIEPSVGVFVDGVYRSRSASQITDLPDVQRVEVLRGPQSTLFGKNASAGVISIVTQKPKFEFGGNVEGSYGNYNAMVIKGVVTGPLSETIAASLAGGINSRDGYTRNPATGTRVSDRNRWFVRGQLLFEPADDLSIRLIGDYGKINEICCGVFAAQTGAATGILTSPLIGGRVNDPSRLFGDVVYLNTNPTNKVKNYGFSGQIDYKLGEATLTSITAYRESKLRSNFDVDFTSADLLNGANVSRMDLQTFTQELRLAGGIGDRLSYVLGGFYFNEKVRQDGDLTWGRNARTFADTLVRGLSNNAQNIPALETLFGTLTGNPTRYTGQFFAAGQKLTERDRMKDENYSIFGQLDFEVTDRLTLTGGLNYTHDKKRYSVNVTSNDVFANLNLVALRNAATSAGIAQTIGGLLQVPGGFANAAQIGAFAAAQPAAFGQIQAGAAAATAPLLRLRPLQFLPSILGVPNAVESGRTSDSKLTYTIRAAYDVNDRLNGYVSYSTGFKASSVNLSRDSKPFARDAAALTAAGIAFPNQEYSTRYADPENSYVYEAGLKGSWPAFSFNLAAFYQYIKGFQSNIFTGTGFVLRNAGKQSVKGVEFESTVRPVDGLSLGLAATFLRPKYDDFTNSAFGDATGIKVADIPRFSGTISADYDHDMGDSGKLMFHADFHHESEVQVVEGLPGFFVTNPTTGVVDVAPGLAAARNFTREVNELNASVTWALTNGMEFTVWGRNVTNDRYINTVFDSPAQQGSVSAYTNQPRTYGISARYRW